MKLNEIFNRNNLEDRNILDTIEKHQKEIEDEQTRQRSMQGFDISGLSDIDKVPYLYSSGDEADAALADDIIDVEHRRLRQRQPKSRRKSVNASSAKKEQKIKRCESAERARKLVESYLKHQNKLIREGASTSTSIFKTAYSTKTGHL